MEFFDFFKEKIRILQKKVAALRKVSRNKCADFVVVLSSYSSEKKPECEGQLRNVNVHVDLM